VRDPRGEAAARLGGRHEVRVLEPSPPAVGEAPWFADDPVAGGDVVPVERPGTRSWASLCAELGDTALVPFCLERWLGPWRRLEPLPATFARTRADLHAVAAHVLCPARHAATGRIGLRWTLGGFGTPFFGDDRQVRVERGVLVADDRPAPLTTLGEAAAFVGVTGGAPTGGAPTGGAPTGGFPTGGFPSTADSDPDRRLDVEPLAASALGDWFGFCTSVLEQLRAEAGPADAAGRVQLWPEHFDVAVDLGEADGRANFGGSPGDERHPEPYLYVGPWTVRPGTFWNEPFGASLPYAALVGAVDQRGAALQFLRTARDLLRR